MRKYVLGLFLPLVLCYGREPGSFIKEALFCLGRPVQGGYNRLSMEEGYSTTDYVKINYIDENITLAVNKDEKSGLVYSTCILAAFYDPDEAVAFLTPYHTYLKNNYWTHIDKEDGSDMYGKRGVYAVTSIDKRESGIISVIILFTRDLTLAISELRY